MNTTTTEHSHMNHHTSLENQQATALNKDFSRAIDGLKLHGFTLHSMRKEDGVLLLCNADSSWTVEVTQMGLVRTLGGKRAWTDFYTWQFHNQSRLMYTEAE